MADVHMIWADGVRMPDPSVCEWGLMDISAPSAGRSHTDDRMNKKRTSQKRKLNLAWNNKSPETTALILQAFNPEYIQVRYPDSMSGQYETREFYCGDRSAQVRSWTISNRRYSTISFNLTER